MTNKKIAIISFVLIILTACQNSSSDTNNDTNEPAVKKEVVKDFNYYMDRISNDPQWMNDIKKQALEQGMSIDSMVIKNAKYMAKQNGFVDESEKENEINTQIETIKNNAEWYQTVEAQAKERQITVDEMLVRTAKYVIEKRNNKTN